MTHSSPPSARRRSRPQPRRDELLQKAYELFNRQGYHATGIDQILAESGVAKATLYKYFPSKEELILAVLDKRHQQLVRLMSANLAGKTGTESILAIFDSFDVWFHSPDFQGCNFIHASAEYADPAHPVHLCAANHKNWLKGLLQEGLTTFPSEAGEAVAEQLLILLDGAIVAAQVRGKLDAALIARRAAETLLRQPMPAS